MSDNLYSKRISSAIDPSVYTVKSRYDRKTRLHVKDEQTNIIRSMKYRDMVPQRTDEDSIFVVTVKEMYRPDIIALNYYGDPILYWVILAANNMKTPSEVKEGLHLRIPSISSVYGTNGVMVK